jgi:hypothetical protein
MPSDSMQARYGQLPAVHLEGSYHLYNSCSGNSTGYQLCATPVTVAAETALVTSCVQPL